MLRIVPLVVACFLLFPGPIAVAETPPTASVELPGPPMNEGAGYTPGFGPASVWLDRANHKLTIYVAFQGLASKATTVRLHCCVRPDGFAVWATMPFGSPVFSPVGTFDGSISAEVLTNVDSTWSREFLDSGTAAQAETKFWSEFDAGKVYVVVYTANFPEKDGVKGGEMRGFFTP